MNRQPPIVPQAAIRLLIPAERLEEIEGDLAELFDAQVDELGVRPARLRYWHDAATVIVQCRRVRRTHRQRTKSWKGMTTMLFDALNELKHAARALAKRPGYTAVAIVTLALGIGANVAIFTVVNAILLRPLPYPDSDRIVEVRHHAPGLNMPNLESAPGLIARYREHARSLAVVAGYDMRLINLADVGTPERVRAVAVTPEIFDVLATPLR